jgi:transmembrane sensor
MAEDLLQPCLREMAATWHARMAREHVPEGTRHEFAHWLAQSPENRAAYEAIDNSYSILQHAAQEPEILALRHEAALRVARRTPQSRPPRRRMAAAATLIGLFAASAMLMFGPLKDRSLIAWLLEPFHTQSNGFYATATGERSTIVLSEGSQITLDTQSEIEVAFNKAERIVRLIRGQAIFEVAKDPARPFVVDVHRRRFLAVGTAFDVRVDGAQIRVTMIEGTVRVEPSAIESLITNANGVARATESTDRLPLPFSAYPVEKELLAHDGDSKGNAILLTAGEQLTVKNGGDDRVSKENSDRITSWRHGQVIFENTRLADAIAELNRYSESKIELADPRLADLRLNGAFATGRPTVFVEAVATYFPIQVVRSDDRAIVLTSRE